MNSVINEKSYVNSLYANNSPKKKTEDQLIDDISKNAAQKMVELTTSINSIDPSVYRNKKFTQCIIVTITIATTAAAASLIFIRNSIVFVILLIV